RNQGVLEMDVEARPAIVSHRVMVVDDNMDELALLSTFVQLSGYEVKTARDGVEALEVAKDFRPEVVLMDIGMPRLDGLEAAKSLRRQPWGRDMRLIALSGWAQVSDR